MKMKSLFFAVLLALGTSTFAFGNDEPGMTVVSVKGSQIFKVIYRGSETGKVKMNILDANGKVIHSETFAGLNGFIIPVNFKGVASGNYTIEVVDSSGKYQENVSNGPAFDLKSIHVSKILTEEGKFLLAMANVQDEPIRVTIYDRSDKVVYNESKTVNGDFAQVYRIEKPGGRYTFEISDAAGNSKYFTF